MTRSVHKDLGIVMSDDLSWNQHCEKIIPKASVVQNAGTASLLFQPVSVCFCKENLILIIGEIAS